jgi:DNA helicase-2/ATP-dependent DNA helicase PcrA
MTLRPTPEQQAIIDYPLLPLRVTAGAGTGKTTTMAMRLAAKIGSGEVAADRTLGITFTNKAAEGLAGTIRTMIDDRVASGTEVEVTTYHGFAFGLVREFGPLIGIPRSVRVATPGYARQLLRGALATEPRLHLDLTYPALPIGRLLTLSSALGDHLIDPTEVARWSGLEARAEIASVLERFSEQKRELGVVDYGDLIAAAHRIVTSHAEVAARIRARYELVLLDEYQDTNPAQRRLLQTIFGGGFPVTAVGDSDQTIYEWRGASPQNFAAFPEHFPESDGAPAASLQLATSWRSGTRIVSVANAIRERISEPSPLPELRARSGAPSGSISAHWLHSSVSEAHWIADQVVRRHEAGAAWRDVAVLFRKHRQMGVIRDALVAAGIPVEVVSLGGLLEVPEVADLHAWLRVIGRPDDAPALARILLGSRFRLGLADLAPLARWVRHRRRASDEATLGWALIEAIDELETVTGLSDAARDRLGRFRADYRTLLSIAQSVDLVELCRRILDVTGAWPEIEALPDAARTSARLNTHRFLDLAEDWSPLQGSPSLEAFLDHLDVLGEESGDELDTARVSGEDAVVLLTVHRAKGLEWPIVFLPALAEDTFPSRVIRYADPVSDPFVIPHDARLDTDALPVLGEDEKERRRLLRAVHDDGEWRTAYVAATRAADEIVASGAWWYTERTPRRRSPLFEIIDALADPADDRSEAPGEPPEHLRLGANSAPAPDPHFADGVAVLLAAAIEDPETPRQRAADAGIVEQYDAAVDQLRIQLEGLPTDPDPTPEDDRFVASVTGLVAYAGCPLRFRWSHLDRLPRRPSVAARRGVELHRRIELFHRGTVSFDEATPDFYDSVEEPSGAPVASAFDRFAASRFADARPMLIETPFELALGATRVTGRIDAVYELAPGHWEIVDFKSGRPSRDPARFVQLEAYAIAADEAGLGGGRTPEDITVTFAYFGGDQAHEESTRVDAEWLDSARSHLEELVAGAAAGPYPAEPGDRCRSCDFSGFCDEGSAWIEANR